MMYVWLSFFVIKIEHRKQFMQFFTTGAILDWSAVLVLVTVGGFAIYGIYDQEKKKREQEVDAADDRLISLLKGTVESLTSQVETLKVQVDKLSKEVAGLKSENTLLRSILQGRDGDAEKLRIDAEAAIKRNKETLDMVKEISKSTRDTNKNIENLYTLINRHLEMVEKMVNN